MEFIFLTWNLYDVVLPSQVQMTGIKWHGEGYSIKLNAGDYPFFLSVYINENMSFHQGASSISSGYVKDSIPFDTIGNEDENQERAYHRVYEFGENSPKETFSVYQTGNNFRGIAERIKQYNGAGNVLVSIGVSYKTERICWYAVIKRTELANVFNDEYISLARQWVQAIDIVPLATAG